MNDRSVRQLKRLFRQGETGQATPMDEEAIMGQLQQVDTLHQAYVVPVGTILFHGTRAPWVLRPGSFLTEHFELACKFTKNFVMVGMTTRSLRLMDLDPKQTFDKFKWRQLMGVRARETDVPTEEKVTMINEGSAEVMSLLAMSQRLGYDGYRSYAPPDETHFPVCKNKQHPSIRINPTYPETAGHVAELVVQDTRAIRLMTYFFIPPHNAFHPCLIPLPFIQDKLLTCMSHVDGRALTRLLQEQYPTPCEELHAEDMAFIQTIQCVPPELYQDQMNGPRLFDLVLRSQSLMVNTIWLNTVQNNDPLLVVALYKIFQAYRSSLRSDTPFHDTFQLINQRFGQAFTHTPQYGGMPQPRVPMGFFLYLAGWLIFLRDPTLSDWTLDIGTYASDPYVTKKTFPLNMENCVALWYLFSAIMPQIPSEIAQPILTYPHFTVDFKQEYQRRTMGRHWAKEYVEALRKVPILPNLE